MSSTEIEFAPLTPVVEVRSKGGRVVGDQIVGGYAAMFGSLSRDFGGWKEVVEKSFFNKSLGDNGFRDVVCKYEHRDLLGTVRAGTLDVQVDQSGLPFEVSIPRGRSDVYELCDRGDVAGASFAFAHAQDEWRHEDGFAVRHLISGQLLDVSITANPAYEAAHVGLRSLDSLARQCEVDPNDVYELARRRELPKLFVRSDNRGVAPTPTLVEARNRAAEPQVAPADLKRRLDANRHRAMDANREGRIDLIRRLEANRKRSETFDLEARMAENHRRLLKPVELEQRSVWWSASP